MPDRVLAGIDGYPKGWVIAVASERAITWRTCGVHDLRPAIADLDRVAIDIPIVLAERDWRACDVETKAALGRAGSRTFMMPPRAVVELGLAAPNELVQERCRALTGQGVSRQAMALSERVLAVDALLPDVRLAEVHPELVFAAIAGSVLVSKKSAAGVGARMQALDPWLATFGTTSARLLERCPVDVPADDALDALAALVGAHRIEGGIAQRWPAHGDGPTIWA